jgi:N-acetylneuraminic acid mutarotase
MSKSLVFLLAVLLCLSALPLAVRPAYGSVADSWVEKTPMPTGRGGLGIIAVNDTIYAIGGAASPSTGFVGTNELYNSSTNSWVSKAPMPTPRAYFAIAAYHGKIYCMGGQVGQYQEAAMDNLWGPLTTSVNEVYDIANDSWTTLAPMPFSNFYLSACVINDRIYVLSPGTTYVYDPSKDLWGKLTPMPYPKGGAWAKSLPVAAVDGNILVAGQITSTILSYNVCENSWSKIQTETLSIDTGAGAATSGVNSLIRFYVMGYSPSVCFAYDPQTATWTSTSVMPNQRTGFGLTTLNDTIYAIGGFTSSANEQYYPLGYGSPDPIYALQHYPPKIRIEQIQNSGNSSVPLAFNSDKELDWISYSLDGKNNVTITGNTTITGLPSGQHNVTVYANDTYDNIAASETITFTVETDQTFGVIVLITASVVVIACVGVGILLYKRHRKHAGSV